MDIIDGKLEGAGTAVGGERKRECFSDSGDESCGFGDEGKRECFSDSGDESCGFGDEGKREGFSDSGENSGLGSGKKLERSSGFGGDENSGFVGGKPHGYFMGVALCEAGKAAGVGDVPVGAVVVLDGNIIARAHNKREKNNDPTAHAEILAIKKAAKKLGRWNLSDCSIYITLEPCAMCAGAIVNSRLNTVIFGAHDKRFGCGGSLYNLLNNSGLNHNANVISGVRAEECGEVISGFFRRIRGLMNNE